MVSRVLLIAYLSTALLAASAAATVPAGAAEPSMETAAQALAAGNTAGAIDGYSAALASGKLNKSELIDVLLHRGFAYQTAGNFENAIADYTKVLTTSELEKTVQVTVYYNRGLAQQNIGNLRAAIEDFTNAVFADRQFAYGYYARANALRENGNFLFALSDYEKAALYSYPLIHLSLYGEALTYEKLNRPLKAEALLQQALAAKPDFAPAISKLAELRNSSQSDRTGLLASGQSSPVVVSSNSYYGIISDRIDQIITSSVSPVAPDQVVRKAPLPRAVRPPRHLLEAAEEVEVAILQLPGLQMIALAQTPGYVAPGFVVAEKTKFQKFQDRIATADDESAEPGVRVEPVSAPVEFTTKTSRDEQTKSAIVAGAVTPPASDMTTGTIETASADPQPEGWLVQINSQRSEDAAWAAWKKLQAKHASLLNARQAMVQKAEIGVGGIVYRVHIKGLGTQNAAKDLCRSLKDHRVACFVVKAGS